MLRAPDHRLASDAEQAYYIMDTRSLCGDCVTWWAPKSSGYVVSLEDAGIYDQAFVDHLHRATDVPVPVEVARELARSHVHVENLLARGYRRPRPPAPPPIDLSLALLLDPFDGDYGDGERRLRDAIVRARKSHECHTSLTHRIRPGDRHRVMVERARDGLREYRWCHECTKAQALGEPW